MGGLAIAEGEGDIGVSVDFAVTAFAVFVKGSPVVVDAILAD